MQLGLFGGVWEHQGHLAGWQEVGAELSREFQAGQMKALPSLPFSDLGEASWRGRGVELAAGRTFHSTTWCSGLKTHSRLLTKGAVRLLAKKRPRNETPVRSW